MQGEKGKCQDQCKSGTFTVIMFLLSKHIMHILYCLLFPLYFFHLQASASALLAQTPSVTASRASAACGCQKGPSKPASFSHSSVWPALNSEPSFELGACFVHVLSKCISPTGWSSLHTYTCYSQKWSVDMPG